MCLFSARCGRDLATAGGTLSRRVRLWRLPGVDAGRHGGLLRAQNVGANYGLVFTAFGVSGFFVPRYFAEIVDAAKKAGNIAAGYNQVYRSWPAWRPPAGCWR